MALGSYSGGIGAIAGGIIGGIIGSQFGATYQGALLGASIGGMAGGVAGQTLWPEKVTVNHPPPPQPHENRQQISTYGSPIPIVYESSRLAGNIIYMQDVNQTVTRSKHRQDGVRYYEIVNTYSSTFAIAFCEGPVVGIARIWVNGKIFVDWRDPAGSYYPTGSVGYASGNLDTSVARRETFFRIHTGTETQAYDQSLASILTAAETPAYRGICYIVFIDFPVGEFSGVPQIEIELDSEIVYVEPVYYITENVNDDYGYTSGGSTIRHDNIGCGNSGGIPLKAFVLFKNVDINAGSTFSEVSLIFKVFAEYAGTTGVVNFEVRVNEIDNAVAPANSAAFEALTWSNTYVDGQHVYAGGTGTDTTVLNLSSLVQSIIDRPGWVSGNAIMFRLTPKTGNGANDYVLWRDAYSGSSRPSITVKYW